MRTITAILFLLFAASCVQGVCFPKTTADLSSDLVGGCKEVRLVDTELERIQGLTGGPQLEVISILGNNQMTEIEAFDLSDADVDLTIRNNPSLRSVQVKVKGANVSLDRSIETLTIDSAESVNLLLETNPSEFRGQFSGTGATTLALFGVSESFRFQRSNVDPLHISIDRVPSGFDSSSLIGLGVPQSATFFTYEGGATLEDFGPLTRFYSGETVEGGAQLCYQDRVPPSCESILSEPGN